MKFIKVFLSEEERQAYEKAYSDYVKQKEHMNTNKSELNTAIDNLSSICPKGREEVRALVETITGVKLKEEEPLKIVHKGIYGPLSQKDQIVLLKQCDKDIWAVVWLNGLNRDLMLLNREIFGDVPGNPMSTEKIKGFLTSWNYTLQGTISFVKQ